MADDPQGLGIVEIIAPAVDGVGGGVEQIGVGLGNVADDAWLADGTCGDETMDLVGLRSEAALVADGEFDTVLVAGGDHIIGIAEIVSDGLFAEDSFDANCSGGNGRCRPRTLPSGYADDIERFTC